MAYTYSVLRRHGLYSQDSWPQTLKVSVSVCVHTNANEVTLEAVHISIYMYGLCNSFIYSCSLSLYSPVLLLLITLIYVYFSDHLNSWPVKVPLYRQLLKVNDKSDGFYMSTLLQDNIV